MVSKGNNGQGWAGRFGVCYLNDLSWLWGMETVPGCLVSGPGANRATYDGLEWENAQTGGDGDMDLISCSRRGAKGPLGRAFKLSQGDI